MSALDFIYHAGVTRRFHTWPVIRQQSVADHSWHVAMLMAYIFGNTEPGVSYSMIMAALTHDMAECRVGDLPAPAKRTMDARLEIVERGAVTNFRDAWGRMEQEILKEYDMDWEKFLSPEELAALKLCDSMEGAFYCVNERAMGNKLIEPCYRNFISYVEELLEKHFPVSPYVPFESEEETSADTAHRVYNHIKDLWDGANS